MAARRVGLFAHMVVVGLMLAGMSQFAAFTLAGTRAPPVRSAGARKVACRGWRLDRLLTEDCSDGSDIAEGFWTGELYMKKMMNSRGMRYAMRPTSEEVKNGFGPKPVSFGPIKVRVGEVLGGTGSSTKYRNRDEGMAMGWDEGGDISEPFGEKVAPQKYKWMKRNPQTADPEKKDPKDVISYPGVILDKKDDFKAWNF